MITSTSPPKIRRKSPERPSRTPACTKKLDTYIKVHPDENLLAISTHRELAINKTLALIGITVKGTMYPIASYKAHEPCNARGVIYGVPLDWSTDHILDELRVPRHKTLGIRRLGQTKTILITNEGPQLPREAILCMLVLRIYPRRTRCQQCA